MFTISLPHFNDTLVTLAAKISRSDLFKNFFLAAQFASWEGGESEIQLTVHLLNGKNVTVKASALDRADVIQVVSTPPSLNISTVLTV